MPHLFDSYQLKDVKLCNRIGVSPMCQYSAEDGMPTDIQIAHAGRKASAARPWEGDHSLKDWPYRAAQELHQKETATLPVQYASWL